MRFILLRRKTGKTFYDTILNIGCGPNFVLNRKDLFLTMIKEQGVTFWFRFWILVYFNHGCFHLTTIQEYLPDVMFYAITYIHKRFLQGSENEASQYCLKVLKSMRNKTKDESAEEKIRDLTTLRELVTKTLEMIFGAALCEVFYKWLCANEMDDKSRKYWSIPREYLDVNFQPGKLEYFLVNGWKEHLVTLLDVPENRIPWVQVLLEDKVYPPQENQEEQLKYFELSNFIQDIADGMLQYKAARINEIQGVDELPNKKNNKLDKLLLSPEGNPQKPTEDKFCDGDGYKENEVLAETTSSCGIKTNSIPSSDVLFKPKKKTQQVCCFCGAVNDGFTRLIKCQKCITENCENPKFYCGANCQVEHWFKTHSREHSTRPAESTGPCIKSTAIFKRSEAWSYIHTITITVLIILCSPIVLDLCYTGVNYFTESKPKLPDDENSGFFVN